MEATVMDKKRIRKRTNKQTIYCRYIKRLLSILLSLGGFICLSWLFALIVLAIKLTSPGPVFFRQKRVGIHKKHFEIYKFRTMRTDTPHDIPTHLLENPDQYITPVGRFLRKTSLDELPQLINILKGDMAVVGPRPALWNQYDLIEEREKYGANDVRPGLTGWAQIHGRDELEIREKAKLDGYYVKHMGFFMDAVCFIGTIKSVLKKEGVVEGGTGTIGEEKKQKKKILILTNHSYMLWQFRRELIFKLMKDYEVVISCPFVGHEKDFQKKGMRCIETKIDRRGINPFTDFRLLCTYRRLLKKEHPALVITYSIKPNIYAGWLCGKMGIPCCANVQGLGTAFEKPVLSRFVTFLYKIAFRRVRTVFFENKSNAGEFRKRHIVPAEKQVVLHGAGINLNYYCLKPYPCNDKVHYLYLGRIMKEKGIDELFTAVRSLHKKQKNFVLDLVGFFEEEYKPEVEKLEKDGIICFHGFQKDPRPYYQMADCIVLPSYHEGMSNVLLEAAATGRPIITSNIPGCREAVENGTTGFLVPPKDSKSLLHAMEKIYDMSPEERKTMGERGREKMEKEFRKEIVVAKTIKGLGI